MHTVPQQEDNFSLFDGGLFHQARIKLGVHNHQGILALAGVFFAWLPLVIITAADGTLLSGVSMPLLHDLALHARFLLAFPMLILIRNVIDDRTTSVIRCLSRTLLDPQRKQKLLADTLPRVRKWACSSFTEFVLILIIFIVIMGVFKSGAYSGFQGGETSWKFVGDPGANEMSFAGKWFAFVSIPLFQFLLFQWFWRYLVWMALLFRFARMPLRLLPTHADRAGGLGVIILAQMAFLSVFFACAVVISSQRMEFITRNPDAFNMVQMEVIGYIVFCLILLLLPLLFFSAKLVRTKQQGLLQLSRVSAELSGKFEEDWINDLPLERRIEESQVDPSMTFDYSGLYDLLENIRIVPVNLRDILGMAAVLIVPFLPILFVYYSAADILKRIIGLLM